MQVALLLAEQFVEFAAGLADDWCVIDGGMVALHERADAIDTAPYASSSLSESLMEKSASLQERFSRLHWRALPVRQRATYAGVPFRRARDRTSISTCGGALMKLLHQPADTPIRARFSVCA
jgi:hypothetical protein